MTFLSSQSGDGNDDSADEAVDRHTLALSPVLLINIASTPMYQTVNTWSTNVRQDSCGYSPVLIIYLYNDTHTTGTFHLECKHVVS